ncbi:MAG: hypothetical protein VX527_11215 [Planctomycetota bacterium]|nr:hypothetical protein [Planctomycetota bacterium]
MSKRKRTPGYWAGVLGTAMILLGIFGMSYGWTTVAVGQELKNIAMQLEHQRFGLAVGDVIHAMTIGILNLSGVETGEAAQKLIDLMPTPDFLIWVGYIRIGLSLSGLLIGIALASQARWSVPVGAIWGLITSFWFIYATWLSWNLLNESPDHPVTGINSPIYLVNASLHLIWPAFLSVWLLRAWYKGSSRHWKV